MNVVSLRRLSLVVALAVGGNAPLAAQEPPPMPVDPAPVVAPEAVEYKVIPIAPAIWSGAPTKLTTDLEKTIVQVIRGTLPYLASEKDFTNYYTKYKFPLMTQTSPEQLANLHKERTSFLRDHFSRGKKQVPEAKEAHDKLVELTFKSMKVIVADNYHPAVRYNAMLIIGDLNTKEAQTVGGQVPAEPYAPARDFLIAEATNPKQIDAVKLAALLGLLRHAEHNAERSVETRWTAADRATLVKQILPLALDKKVGPAQTPEGHAWLRGRAVEVLAALGKAAPDASVTQTLVQIIGDDTEPLSLRLVAADSLGQLNLATGTVSGSDVGRKLADLSLAASKSLLAVVDKEIAEIRDVMKKEGGGSVTSLEPYYNRLDASATLPSYLKRQARIKLVCRQLKDQTARVAYGLKGPDGTLGALSAAKAQAQKDYLTNVSKSVAALSKVAEQVTPTPVDPDRIHLLTLAKDMRASITDLERVAKTGGAPAAPAVVPVVPGAEGPGELPETPAVAPPAAAVKPAAPPALPAELPEAPADAAKK